MSRVGTVLNLPARAVISEIARFAFATAPPASIDCQRAASLVGTVLNCFVEAFISMIA
jgi:hypothetical protein